MEGITYVNLIGISLVVIEIRGVENGELAVPVNNMLVRHTSFLAADTQLDTMLTANLGICSDNFILCVYIFKSMLIIFRNKFRVLIVNICMINFSIWWKANKLLWHKTTVPRSLLM